MKEFDYIIIGGGCAGLSLAYELQMNKKLESKSLAIIEKRPDYKRDRTWSFWKVFNHNFEDCVIKAVNRGHDSDTCGAVAGMIAGAHYGIGGIPDHLFDNLMWKERITDTAYLLWSIRGDAKWK